MPLRVGVLGTGFAGSMHARSALATRGAQVVAVAAVPLDDAAALAKECGARVASAEEICSADDIDLVVVATPTYLHAAHVIAAARGRQHASCEKPLARTLADAEAMVRACDEAGVTLAVGHVVRFFPEYPQAQGLVDAGTPRRPATGTPTPRHFAGGRAPAWAPPRGQRGGVGAGPT